jgi:hypothetical protein
MAKNRSDHPRRDTERIPIRSQSSPEGIPTFPNAPRTQFKFATLNGIVFGSGFVTLGVFFDGRFNDAGSKTVKIMRRASGIR